MHHSLKIKILDLDDIKSIVEQDIIDVGAERIVGGSEHVPANCYCSYCQMDIPSIVDPGTSTWRLSIESASELVLTKTLANALTKKLDLSLDLFSIGQSDRLTHSLNVGINTIPNVGINAIN